MINMATAFYRPFASRKSDTDLSRRQSFPVGVRVHGAMTEILTLQDAQALLTQLNAAIGAAEFHQPFDAIERHGNVLDDPKMAGWNEWNTGGGCMAAGKVLASNIDGSSRISAYIIDDGVPHDINSECYLCFDNATETFASFRCDTVLDALAIVAQFRTEDF